MQTCTPARSASRVTLLIQVKEEQRGTAARGRPPGWYPRQPPPRTSFPSPGVSTHTRPADATACASECDGELDHGPRVAAHLGLRHRSRSRVSRSCRNFSLYLAPRLVVAWRELVRLFVWSARRCQHHSAPGRLRALTSKALAAPLGGVSPSTRAAGRRADGHYPRMVRLVNSVFGPHTVFWHALGLLVLVGLLLGAVIGGSVWATVIFSVGVSLQTTILVFLVGWKRQMRRRLAGR
jgi:hypothetical protein